MKSLRELSAELLAPAKREEAAPLIDMAQLEEARDRARTALAEARAVMARLEASK